MKYKRNKGVNDAKKVAFTLAEVLITLGIIGVVLALIMPTVISKTKDKQYKAARAKALSTIGNASKNIAVQGNMNDAQNAKDFVNNILRSQIAIAKTCENDKLEDCGLPRRFMNQNGYEVGMPRLLSDFVTFIDSRADKIGGYKSYGFLTSDGYAYNLFYFPGCSGNRPTEDISVDILKLVCVNAFYDMNGLRGPNQFGKDIGVVTVFYPNETVQAVAPMTGTKILGSSSLEYPEAQQYCAEKGKRLPNFEEGMSVILNYMLYLVGGTDSMAVWTLSTDGPRAIMLNGIAFAKKHFNISTARAECVE